MNSRREAGEGGQADARKTSEAGAEGGGHGWRRAVGGMLAACLGVMRTSHWRLIGRHTLILRGENKERSGNSSPLEYMIHGMQSDWKWKWNSSEDLHGSCDSKFQSRDKMACVRMTTHMAKARVAFSSQPLLSFIEGNNVTRCKQLPIYTYAGH